MHKLMVKAVREGQVKLCQILLEGGVDPNYETKDGENLLTLAIESHHDIHVKYQILSKLIKHGANVNKKDKNGKTVLIRAVLCPNPSAEIVSLIIENGAVLLEVDNFGLTAMDYAQQMNNMYIYRLILKGTKSLENKIRFKLKNFFKFFERRSPGYYVKRTDAQDKNQEFDDVFLEQTDDQEPACAAFPEERVRTNTISSPLLWRTRANLYKPKTTSCTTALSTNYPTSSDPFKKEGRKQTSELTGKFIPRPPYQYVDDKYIEKTRRKQQEQVASDPPGFQKPSHRYMEEFHASGTDAQDKYQEFDDVFLEQTDDQESACAAFPEGRVRTKTISLPLRWRTRANLYKPKTTSCTTALSTNYPTTSDPFKKEGRKQTSELTGKFIPRPPYQYVDDKYIEKTRRKQQEQVASDPPGFQKPSHCYMEEFHVSGTDAQDKNQEFDDVFLEQTDDQEPACAAFPEERVRTNTISSPLLWRTRANLYKPKTTSCTTALSTNYPTSSDPFEKEGRKQTSELTGKFIPRQPYQCVDDKYIEKTCRKQQEQVASDPPGFQKPSHCYMGEFHVSGKKAPELENGIILNDIEIDIDNKQRNTKIKCRSEEKRKYQESISDGNGAGAMTMLNDIEIDIDNKEKNRKIKYRSEDKRKHQEDISYGNGVGGMTNSTLYKQFFSNGTSSDKSNENDVKKLQRSKMPPRRLLYTKESTDSLKLPTI